MAEKASSQEPWQRHENWQNAAIAAGVITIGCSLFVLPWIFGATSDRTMLYRVQMSGAGLAVGLAIVTFCTVIWRGLISLEQANLQRLQIDRLTDQIKLTRESIDATRETNLADLLQRGAELIADRKKPSHMAAGVAILRAVAVEPAGLFASEAMNLLADFIQVEIDTEGDSDLFRAASIALNDGVKQGRRASRTLRIDRSDVGQVRQVIGGVDSVTWIGGTMGSEEASDLRNPSYRFSGVTIYFVDLVEIIGERFHNCTFNNCTINGGVVSGVMGCTFERCGFSDVRFDWTALSTISLDQNNWYDLDRPVKCSGTMADINHHLHPGPPFSDWIDGSA